ncbi:MULTISPECIES: helix-turn-helix domain-containing protein [unclassified Paenibacillus]|uniref:helix-turn-helix domain-containing protein n=1 Tax=unclassified Paenibacillus TaxID=185978 RepID=UPI00020D71CA|nr:MULTISPECIES: helix-turn-helix domain-containing protein [unclassified Paenibacillus]EGL19995.1 transcriptional regulator, AraC family [Paenibacillus sp. HGF7]EPD88473.1 hypothetical protein HMPREF1207_02298 [Paenibacillus sp. HGH0039]
MKPEENPVIVNKGILNYEKGRQKFNISRRLPAPELAFFIRHYWLIHWDLRGLPSHTQEVLQPPCFNLVFEKDNTRIYGTNKGKLSQLLEGKGEVFGVLFRPGGFYPFYRQPASELVNRSLPFQKVFGRSCLPLEEALFSEPDEEAKVRFVDDFFIRERPPADEQIEIVNSVIDYIAGHREINRVEDVGARFGISARTMQRMFSQYVGVSPKWVIKRYRLQDAAVSADAGESPDWSKLAVDLGYYDQAHLIKDFKTVIGKSPEEYVRGKQG